MIAIFRKEVNLFLSSLIGYVAVTLFLVANGLIAWVFTDSSIPAAGFANLEPLFMFAPWILLLLVPAVTMRSLAEEQATGTIELLATKPVSDWAIIGGKYLAALFLVVLALLPTLIYYVAVSRLASPPGNVDSGAVAGSYIGLVLLGATFTAIGLFTSSLTSNQIVAFIGALFGCFVVYQVFDSLALLPAFTGTADAWLDRLSLSAHYRNISKGLIDTRDVLYFLSLIALFLVMTRTVLGSRRW